MSTGDSVAKTLHAQQSESPPEYDESQLREMSTNSVFENGNSLAQIIDEGICNLLQLSDDDELTQYIDRENDTIVLKKES